MRHLTSEETKARGSYYAPTGDVKPVKPKKQVRKSPTKHQGLSRRENFEARRRRSFLEDKKWEKTSGFALNTHVRETGASKGLPMLLKLDWLEAQGVLDRMSHMTVALSGIIGKSELLDRLMTVGEKDAFTDLEVRAVEMFARLKKAGAKKHIERLEAKLVEFRAEIVLNAIRRAVGKAGAVKDNRDLPIVFTPPMLAARRSILESVLGFYEEARKLHSKLEEAKRKAGKPADEKVSEKREDRGGKNQRVKSHKPGRGKGRTVAKQTVVALSATD